MNKYFKYLGISILTLFFTGCTDDDIQNDDPGNAVFDLYFYSLEEVESAVNGVYQTFFDPGLYSSEGGIIIVGDGLSDNVVQNPGGRGTFNAGYNWLYNSGTGSPTGIYSTGYKMASRANAIINNSDKFLIDSLLTPAEVQTKKQLLAEAYALRAIGHFEVARGFAKIPTQSSDANSSTGIAYVEIFDPLAQPSRLATVAEVYNKIIDDLLIAYTNIPTTSSSSFRLNKNGVAAMLAKVYLYMGRYDKVIEYGAPVANSVNVCASGDIANFWRSNLPTGAGGAILETHVIQSTTFPPIIGVNYSQGANSALKAEFVADKAFYDLFSADDKRRTPYFKIVTPTGLEPIISVNKYVSSAFGEGMQRGRYIRVEDVLLNVAEAQYLSGDQAGALISLNKLRDERYTSYTGGESGDALFNAIQLERRKEFAFEGDRFYTVKRLLGVPGIPVQYSQGMVRSGNGHNADGSGVPPAYLTLLPSAREWQFPLGNSVLIYNPNMTQTPGYE